MIVFIVDRFVPEYILPVSKMRVYHLNNIDTENSVNLVFLFALGKAEFVTVVAEPKKMVIHFFVQFFKVKTPAI